MVVRAQGFTIILAGLLAPQTSGGALDNIERKVIEALSQVISPLAAESLLKRALGGRSPNLLGPLGWATLIEGPLQQELRGILPVNDLLPELEKLTRQLKAQIPIHPSLEVSDPVQHIDLQNKEMRENLVLELARGEGVLAVVLESGYGQEYRLGDYDSSLVNLLATTHRLFERRGGYRVFYTVLEEAQLVLRPLGRGYLAVLTRNEASLGHLLYRMGKIEALQVGTQR